MRLFDEILNNIRNYTGEELAEKIAENMYKEKFVREEILKYPMFIQTLVFIIDFDTELNMEGIYGVLENSIGLFLPHIIGAFRLIGDQSDADILTEIWNLAGPLKPKEGQRTEDFEEYQITSFVQNYDLDEETEERIEALANQLYLETGFDMWSLLFSYLDEEIKKETAS